MADTQEVRLVRRGDQKQPAQLFSALHIKAFDAVLDYAITINDAIECRSPVTISCSRLTPVDYLVAVQQAIAAADLNKGMLKNFRKLFRGEEIGTGSRNMLIQRLGPLFLSKEYSLYPRSRFFLSSAGLRDEKNRLRLPKMPKKPTEVLASLPILDAGQRYFDAEGQVISKAQHQQAPIDIIAAQERAEANRVAAEERAAAEQAMLDEPFYFPEDPFQRQEYDAT